MTNSRRYMDINSGDNEWLNDPPIDPSEEDQKAWDEAWELLKQDCAHKIEFTDGIYSSCEFEGLPEWIDVHIRDDYILQYKMAKGIISSLQGADAITFSSGFDCDVSKEWGGIGHEKLSIHDKSAYVTLTSKHSNDELEVDITEQFNQAIGEV